MTPGVCVKGKEGICENLSVKILPAEPNSRSFPQNDLSVLTLVNAKG